MKIDFKTWLEYESAKEEGMKDTVLNFLKDALNIKDDETILSMKMSSIDSSIVNNLLKRGIIASANSDLLTDVKNGSITVGQLIQRLASGQDNSNQLNLNISSDRQNKFTN